MLSVTPRAVKLQYRNGHFEYIKDMAARLPRWLVGSLQLSLVFTWEMFSIRLSAANENRTGIP